ncbi:MAG TPA: glycosyltransferase family 87 protein, partial [Rubrobacteraceae bacterium]|nr:glycosyltransferase family 87 protein [Rubrobacteraceae bacterium]
MEGSNDLQLYHSTGEALLRGGIPYRDFFIEYPPGSFVTFVPPALLSSDATEFASRFASEMALLLVASLILVALCARNSGGLRAWPVPALVFTNGALMLYPVAGTRYDAVVAFTLAVAAWCAALGERYRLVGYAALGFGAAAKLVPALATLPLALIRTNREGRVIRDAALGYGVFFAVVAAFFVPAYLLGGDDLMRSFAYHAQRGLQVESLGASVMAVLNLVEDVRFEYGAFDVVGPGADLLS